MHRMRASKMRMCGMLLVACWLILNAQLAIAGHQCDITPAASPVFTQHQGHLQPDRLQHSSMHAMPSMMDMSHGQAQNSLCEKHCVPDSIQSDSGVLVLAVLPTHTELMLADAQQTPRVHHVDWHTPPIVGPPTEIAFCRFRE
ncbi:MULTISPECIES: hypothetical protein [Yersinia]|uniref:hypothetical protein n=1 Tax=Yersinia TaxID=629 RepID=UPI00067B96DD|nr:MULTISPECIES: hypothetical protein [Yersinia]OVZ98702.1 hypothetical protein CBW53_03760 [Yersinia frederiksenii]RXA97272.1 hypothetical protein EQP49_07560 [Yersinia sp. 2105 StPb PI]